MTLKGSTIAGVRMVFWILSFLNILCTRQAKPYYSENSDSRFTCDGPLYLFFNVPNCIEAVSSQDRRRHKQHLQCESTKVAP